MYVWAYIWEIGILGTIVLTQNLCAWECDEYLGRMHISGKKGLGREYKLRDKALVIEKEE